MPPVLANIIAVFIVVGLVALSVRTLWKDHKSGGCAGCSGCGGGCGSCGCRPERR